MVWTEAEAARAGGTQKFRSRMRATAAWERALGPDSPSPTALQSANRISFLETSVYPLTLDYLHLHLPPQ